MGRRVKGVGQFIGGAALNLAALGGVICLAFVALAFIFNITLIMFKTGSMSPTIPAGSLSVVREIPATEIKVGDVVTVDRPAALPITHRVTSVAEVPLSTERIITMKGDANEAEDPFPYTVNTVRLVLASVPNLAYGVIWLSNPWVMAVLTIGASTLVTWAFWPRDPSEDDTDLQEDPIPRREPPNNFSQLGLIVLIAPIVLDLALAGAAPTVTEVASSSGQLTIISIGDETAMAQLAPGDPVQWQVGVTTTQRASGEVKIELLGAGNARMGLKTDIRSCDQRWVKGNCGGNVIEVQTSGLVAVDGMKRQLTAMTAEEERWLLFDLWLPMDGPADAGDELVRLQVHASGSGDEVASSPRPIGTLPPTGANPIVPLLAAVGAIVFGLVLAVFAKKRRSRGC
ncbi:signal peptidase I [Arthrobacter sp. UCD-GKA]|uniref:signal peptidase I n=1 Tax=Arthrobacter sp. UCD-GKA TaxID=1913576 RepID=UPI0008DC5D04|nr:signal peptidase I [Arthrobacter sp. UCD-GKA]OIH85134.1 signal peptidase I [Arthrobacter sp. UCD-GKA]